MGWMVVVIADDPRPPPAAVLLLASSVDTEPGGTLTLIATGEERTT
jgi:hypothetical protein